MYISRLTLENFRSYAHRQFEFHPGFNLLIGPNGSGKTNVLESIFLLSTGKSFRATKLSQMVLWHQSYASVIASIVKPAATLDLEVQLLVDPLLPRAPAKKRFLENKTAKTRKQLLGQVKTIVFQPDDIRLVSGSPSRRRQFLDTIFLQSDWRYAQAVSQYAKALRHRNELLDQIQVGKSSRTELYFWDQSLIKNAALIFNGRQDFINHANRFFATFPHPEISQLSLSYRPSVLNSAKMETNFNHDLHRGYTQSGPHVDDFVFENTIFSTPDPALSSWGSRGQQRLAVLALKLAEIDYLQHQSHQKPILLLDDIFSELDTDHQQLVINICRNYQTIITSSDPTSHSLLPQSTLINVE